MKNLFLSKNSVTSNKPYIQVLILKCWNNWQKALKNAAFLGKTIKLLCFITSTAKLVTVLLQAFCLTLKRAFSQTLAIRMIFYENYAPAMKYSC